MEATLQRTGLQPTQRVRGLPSLDLSRRQTKTLSSRTLRPAAPLRAFQNGSASSASPPSPPKPASTPGPAPAAQTPSIPRPALFRSLSVPSLSVPSFSAPSLPTIDFQGPPLPDVGLGQLAPKDKAVALVGRVLISTFSILLLFGGMLAALESNTIQSLAGAVALSSTLLVTALEPLRKAHSGLANKLLSAVLGYLGFNAVTQAVVATPTPLFTVPVYLMLCFVASTAVVFLHPDMYYKKSA